MALENGFGSVGSSWCEKLRNHWIGRADFEGLDLSLSLDGRWVDDSIGQRPWPMNLPPLVSCCVVEC